MYKAYITYWTELIFRRQRIVIQVAVAVFAAVIVATAFWPPTYQSTAQILVRDDRAQLLIAPDISSGANRSNALVSNPVSQEDLNSEIELLTSSHLIGAAVAGVNPPDSERGFTKEFMGGLQSIVSLPSTAYGDLHSTPSVSPRDEWIFKLRQHLDSEAVKRSDVIQVSFRSHDPHWAHEFLTRLMNQYLEFHAQISHDPQAQIFFEHQARQLNSQLQDAEDRLRDFQLKSGISNLPQQNQALINQLAELQLEYKKTAVQLSSARQQVTSLQMLLSKTPQRIENETKSVQNMALAQLKPQIMQLRTERADLLSRYQPSSMKIREIDARLAAAERILQHEDHLEVQERATELNPVWVTLDTNLAAARAAAESLQAGQTDLGDQISKTQEQLATMVGSGVTLTRLQREVQTDNDTYLTYVRKSEEARIAQGLNASRILNVSVSQPPIVPMRPILPIVWVNLLAGALLAVGLGVAAAHWEEQRDPKIYTSTAISEVSGLSTIAVLSEEL
ncbi:MAG: hypothetical protein IVW54_12805 [Candidatus Binataceae bacterium]|nr:hypothetical protein [Candidatus Binataceae bacterium]